jgi:hypothetical protein
MSEKNPRNEMGIKEKVEGNILTRLTVNKIGLLIIHGSIHTNTK